MKSINNRDTPTLMVQQPKLGKTLFFLEVANLVQPWVCSQIITSSNPLKTTYPRKSLAAIVEYVASRMLRAPMGLVKIRDARIYKTLIQTPKIIKKKKKNYKVT